MLLEARHLRIVRAINDTGSLTKAAVTLGLTQPALTHQLQRMERLFGAALFVRDRRGARPTALGAHVVERARLLLPSMDNLVREARVMASASAAAQTLVRVATHPSPLPTAVLAALRELMPTAQVSMRNEPSGQLQLDLIAAGALEVAIVAEFAGLPMARPAEVVVHPVVTEPVFLGISAAHRLATNDEITLSELAEENWAVPDDADIRCAEYVRHLGQQAGITPKIAYRVSAQVARQLISSGMAVGLFQPTASPSEGLVIRPIKGSPADLRHVVAVRAGSPVARYGTELAEAAKRAYWSEARQSAVYRTWLARHGPGDDCRRATAAS